MNDDEDGIDTIILSGSMNNDTITISSDDTIPYISLNDYTYSLSTPTPSIGVMGTVGGTLSTTVNNGLLWGGTLTSASPSYTNQTTGWNTTYNNQPQVLKVEGDADFKGEVTIRGVKLDERLNAIEERLGILRPNNDLEGKWEKLKALGEEYRRIEKEILEGENIWETLKK